MAPYKYICLLLLACNLMCSTVGTKRDAQSQYEQLTLQNLNQRLTRIEERLNEYGTTNRATVHPSMMLDVRELMDFNRRCTMAFGVSEQACHIFPSQFSNKLAAMKEARSCFMEAFTEMSQFNSTNITVGECILYVRDFISTDAV